MAAIDGKKRGIHFGDFAREKRIDKGLGQRELARRLGISASSLNDIEKNNRPAPKLEVFNAMAEILDFDLERAYDLAG